MSTERDLHEEEGEETSEAMQIVEVDAGSHDGTDAVLAVQIEEVAGLRVLVEVDGTTLLGSQFEASEKRRLLRGEGAHLEMHCATEPASLLRT